MKQNTKSSTKILMTADTLGGVWIYALELIQTLEHFDVQVVLATMGRPLNDHQKLQADKLKNLQIEESSYKLEWMQQPWKDVNRAGKWLLELEKKHKPDVIHLNNFVHGALPFRAPVVVVAHSDIFSWWNDVKKESPPPQYLPYHRKVHAGLMKADFVVAPSQYMLTCVNKYYGVFKNQQVIGNARDCTKFHPGQKQPFVFSIGRIWDEAKNIKVLEKIARHSKWPIFIAGENQHPENDISQQFDHLHFLGPLSEEETSKWLSQASVYVMPARYEPFGLSVLEAALSNCALILGDIASLRENWKRAAFFIDPDRPGTLKKTLQMLQQDASLRKAVAEAAYNRAKKFRPDNMGMEYMLVYQKVMEEKEKPLLVQNLQL